MKTIKSLFLLAAFTMSSFFATAQMDSTVYVIVESFKSTAGKTAEYIKAEREVWKKIHQERVKQKLILGWYFYEVQYPQGSNAAYDYVTATFMRGLNRVESPYGTMTAADLPKYLNKDEVAIAIKTEQFRTLVTKQLWYTMDFIQADPLATKPAKFQMMNQMKVKQGDEEAYVKMETQVVKPVFQEMMKAKTTGRFGWGLYGLALPSGANQPCNYTTCDFFNSMEDIAKDSGYQKALEKVHPGMKSEEFSRKINEARSLVNQELWELLDYVR